MDLKTSRRQTQRQRNDGNLTEMIQKINTPPVAEQPGAGDQFKNEDSRDLTPPILPKTNQNKL